MTTDVAPLRFPPLEEIVALGTTEYEQDFLRTEFKPGLEYYVNRLDRLMFSGDAVLDAGCGAGQWALAAAHRFRRVEALDVSPDRLDVLRALIRRMGVTNVSPREGRLERLPYEADSFDAVICYGVLMFTEIERVVAEFHRVLKPGGRLYLCLNAEGWSRYLIRERGPSDERALNAGRETLYNTHLRRAEADDLRATLDRFVAQLEQLTPEWLRSLILRYVDASTLRGWPSGPRTSRGIARSCLESSEIGKRLLTVIAEDCGSRFVERLLDDVWRLACTGTPLPRQIRAEAWTPEEVRTLTTRAGLESFQWAVEAGLACDWLNAQPTPKYEGYYNQTLSVWEALCVKPQPLPVPPVDPSRHVAAARAAREERLFLEPASPSILSSGSRDAYPQNLVRHAQVVAARMGGPRYLEALARAVLDGATTGEDRVRRLIVFVQRSIFRDPVSQPLTPDGGMPDALTVLLCARGQCSHTAYVLTELLRLAGFDARLRQLTNHVVSEVRLGDRWVLADADAFKNGVIPVNRQGHLPTMEDLEADPYQLDRFPPTGWWMRRGSRFARGVGGGTVAGYVDALEPHERGFVSGYYVPAAKGTPPTLPAITRFEMRAGRLQLAWAPSTVNDASRLVGYRVAIGTTSRGWSYDHPGDDDQIVQPLPYDVLRLETAETHVDRPLADAPARLYASVTAVSDRIDKEPETYFWPSEEVRCVRPA